MSTSLAQSLLASSARRVVALEVERGYRDARADELSVALARYVHCSHCARRGCQRCDNVGWYVEQTSAKVLVPQGATPGTRVTVDGVGDEIAGVAASIEVEIVEPGPRADELRAAQADFEGKLETAWTMERAARGGRRRRMAIIAGAAVLVLLLLPIGGWLAKPGAGEPCMKGGDCRSGHCIRLMSGPFVGTKGPTRLDAQVCTVLCKTDLDCPESMRCRLPHTAHEAQYVVDAPDGLVCLPRGY